MKTPIVSGPGCILFVFISPDEPQKKGKGEQEEEEEEELFFRRAGESVFGVATLAVAAPGKKIE
jgi:hypothetical protein